MQSLGGSLMYFFFFSSRRRHTRSLCDWSSDVCSSDLPEAGVRIHEAEVVVDEEVGSLRAQRPGLYLGLQGDRKSTRLNSSHTVISYAVFCLKSEEHTSELQSHSDLVCRLLLEIKRAHCGTSCAEFSNFRYSAMSVPLADARGRLRSSRNAMNRWSLSPAVQREKNNVRCGWRRC